jgi:hypothetical protein
MRALKFGVVGAGLFTLIAVCVVLFASWRTEQDIIVFRNEVAQVGSLFPAPAMEAEGLESLPEPVKRYFAFTFTGSVPPHTSVRLKARGRFRRPLTESFHETSAEQVIAIGAPALMFSATTWFYPGIWARAYDYFARGEMEMKAKVCAVFTVVDQRESPQLNRISLRRWLLESALYPQGLLPGGPVKWAPIDENSARATVTADGLSASLVAHFDAQGRMTHMVAEEDGDLSTPFHGSGEHVKRSDWRQVGNQMIPHDFTISRMAEGKLYPFWEGHVTEIHFVRE